MNKRHNYFYWQLIPVLCFFFLLQTNAQQINTIGGFESNLPSYWTMGNNPGNNSLSWATDQYRSLGHSLKIEKTTTGDSASWISENMADIWSPQHLANVDIKLGAYVKTMNVNTSPANDDAKWWISYTFYDSAGALIGETKLPIDQSIASSSGWIADTNAVGETILPKNSWTTIIKFVAGKNATGTVWADDFVFTGRGGAWAGQDWNTSVGVPTGWYYWLPPIGGNDGQLSNGFENTVVTTEAAHTGMNSLKFDLPFNRDPHDGFVSTKRFMLNGISSDINPGDKIRISVWIKASNLVPDSADAYPTTWAVGLTPGFFAGNGNNLGYSPVGSQNDYQFKFPDATSFDWTQYTLDIQVPDDANTKALEVRLHIYARFTGTIYFDDLQVEKIGSATDVSNDKIIPAKFTVFQNYPNPFNPSTTISYSIPTNSLVSLRIYDILGREVKTLVNSEQRAGVYNMVWNGENNFGNKVASGIYIYRVIAGNNIQTKKMILMK